MKILVIGGTRYFGKHLVNALMGSHDVTIATRGNAPDDFGSRVDRIKIERTSRESIDSMLSGKEYDVVYDNLAYSSNEVRDILDYVSTKKYILTSTTAVYNKVLNTKEADYDPTEKPLVWCSRSDYAYDQVKREAEHALFQQYSDVPAIAVRFPFVIGPDDYTNRLRFYVEHAVKGIPMYIDNFDCQMSFINSSEAGSFLAWLADKDYFGPLNGASDNTISIKEILDYTSQRTNTQYVIPPDGEKAPYNGEREYSINTERAKSLGFKFCDLNEYIFPLIDFYIENLSI